MLAAATAVAAIRNGWWVLPALLLLALAALGTWDVLQTRHTILRWIHAGRLPASRYPMGQWRIARADIQKIQATRRHT